MSNVNTDGLPPEMQARIASIIEKAKTQMPPETPHQAAFAPPAPKQPSLMDHTIALRQEVNQMSQQVAAMGQVVDAVGQAVGQLYAMFQQQTEVTNYSTDYQTQTPTEVNDY